MTFFDERDSGTQILANRLEEMLIVAEPSWSGDKVNNKRKKETQEATLSQAKAEQPQSAKNKTVQMHGNTMKATILQLLTDDKQVNQTANIAQK